MDDEVRDGKVVWIRYTLRDAATGERLDSSGEAPYAYLHGRGNLIAALEAVLAGLSVGDPFDVTLPPEKAYGERQEGWPRSVPRRELKGVDDLQKGMPFRAEGSGGNTVLLWVADIRGSRVLVDVNHPMAGRTLHFEGEVLGLRDPTPEEHEHGHAHGVAGHAH
jgi:FKBP-type peptidyl-prolyl cis-trans isomerase SlyD